MNKTQFWRELRVRDNIASHVWFAWADMWQEANKPGYPPELFDFDVTGDHVTVRHENGTAEIPLDKLYSVDTEPYTILWELNRWDGPLSGVCERDGKRYYFDTHEWEHDNSFYMRRYNIYELPDDVFEFEKARHEEWVNLRDNGPKEAFHAWYECPPPSRIAEAKQHDPVAIVDDTHMRG